MRNCFKDINTKIGLGFAQTIFRFAAPAKTAWLCISTERKRNIKEKTVGFFLKAKKEVNKNA